MHKNSKIIYVIGTLKLTMTDIIMKNKNDIWNKMHLQRNIFLINKLIC